MRPARAVEREPGHPLGPVAGAAEEGPQRERAAVVQVGVVLPGVADAPEHLDALVRAADGGVHRDQRGHRGGELAAGVARLPACMARAASQAAAAACSAAVSIQAQRCLTAWNWPMGRPN